MNTKKRKTQTPRNGKTSHTLNDKLLFYFCIDDQILFVQNNMMKNNGNVRGEFIFMYYKLNI